MQPGVGAAAQACGCAGDPWGLKWADVHAAGRGSCTTVCIRRWRAVHPYFPPFQRHCRPSCPHLGRRKTAAAARGAAPRARWRLPCWAAAPPARPGPPTRWWHTGGTQPLGQQGLQEAPRWRGCRAAPAATGWAQAEGLREQGRQGGRGGERCLGSSTRTALRLPAPRLQAKAPKPAAHPKKAAISCTSSSTAGKLARTGSAAGASDAVPWHGRSRGSAAGSCLLTAVPHSRQRKSKEEEQPRQLHLA